MLVGAVGHGRPRDVARLGSAVLTWTVVVLGACSVAVGLAASPLAGVLVGESGCTGAVDVAADLLRWFAPQPVLLGAGVVLGGILRAHGRPLAAVVGPALGSLVVVGSLVLVPPAGGGQRRHRRPGGTSGGARRRDDPGRAGGRRGSRGPPLARGGRAAPRGPGAGRAGRRDPWRGPGPGAHRARAGLRHGGGGRGDVPVRSGGAARPGIPPGRPPGPVCGVAASRAVRRPAPARRGAHGPGEPGEPGGSSRPRGPRRAGGPNRPGGDDGAHPLGAAPSGTVGRRAGRAGAGGDRPGSGGRVGGWRQPRSPSAGSSPRSTRRGRPPRAERRSTRWPRDSGRARRASCCWASSECCAPPSTCAAGRSSREEPSRPRG